MGKVLKIVVGAAVLFVPGGAAFTFGALGAIGITGATAGLIATSIAFGALGAVLSGVAGLLAPSQNTGEQGQQIRMAAGPAEPREYVYGQRRTGGSIVYRDTRGPDNEDLWVVSVVASHQIDSFQAFHVDEKTVTLTGSAVQTSPYNGFMNIHTGLGTDSQTANATMVSELSNWGSNHRGRGNAYFAVKLKFDQDVYPGGIPNISVVIRGKRVLDTRTSTTVYSANPVLCCLDYMTDSLIGPGFPLSAFDTANINAAANICDQPVSVQSGPDINRYEAHGVVNSEMSHAEVIQLFEKAMAGSITESGGKFRFHPGQWDASVLALDEDDILSISATPAPTRNNLVNAVKGLFIDPAQAYQPQDYPPKTDSAAENEDGGERFWLDLDLGFTTDHRMAQRIAKIGFERNRRRLSARIKTNLVGLGVKVMDVIDITHANWNWTNKTFRVREWSFDPNSATIDMVLSEEDSSVYSWSAAGDEQAYGPPATPTFFSPFGINLGVLGGFGFLSLPFTGSTGITVPGLQAFWSAPGSWAQKIQVQYKGALEAATLYRSIPEQALIGPNKNHFPVVPGNYDVRGRYLTTYGTWSPWASQLGQNIPAGVGDATRGAQLGVNMLNESGVSMFNKHALNSYMSGQNLSTDGGAQIDRGSDGFAIYETFRVNGVNASGSIAHFQPGEVVTVSAWIKKDATAAANNNYCRVLFYSARAGGTFTMSSGAINNLNGLTDTWEYRENTVTIPATLADMDQIRWGMAHTHISGPGTPGAGIVSVREFKVERASVATRFAGLGGLVGYDLADTGQITDAAVAKSKIEDMAVSEPYSDVQNPSPQTMTLAQNTWDPIDGISVAATFPSGEVVDVWILLSGSCHTQDSTGYAIDVRLVESGVQKLLFTYAWGSNDMTTQSEGSFDFSVPLIGRFTGAGLAKTYTVEARLVAPFFSAAGGWQAPLGFRTRDSQLIMRKVAK